MPLVCKQPVGEGFVAVWRREESTAQLLDGLTLSESEQAHYEKIKNSPKRRKEWLTWRRMLRELLGADVWADYDAQGAPVLMNHRGYISVSHSQDYVALCWQPETRCGVDIEDCERNFERVAERYIATEEWLLPGASRTNRFQALVWCAKETAYKFAAQPGLDLIRDICITDIDTHQNQLRIALPARPEIALRYQFLHGQCLVYTL